MKYEIHDFGDLERNETTFNIIQAAHHGKSYKMRRFLQQSTRYMGRRTKIKSRERERKNKRPSKAANHIQ